MSGASIAPASTTPTTIPAKSTPSEPQVSKEHATPERGGNSRPENNNGSAPNDFGSHSGKPNKDDYRGSDGILDNNELQAFNRDSQTYSDSERLKGQKELQLMKQDHDLVMADKKHKSEAERDDKRFAVDMFKAQHDNLLGKLFGK